MSTDVQFEVLTRKMLELPAREVVTGIARILTVQFTTTKPRAGETEGRPYLKGTLAIEHGELVDFKVWEANPEEAASPTNAYVQMHSGNFENETVVLVGRINLYQGKTSLVLSDIMPPAEGVVDSTNLQKPSAVDPAKLEQLFMQVFQKLVATADGRETAEALLGAVQLSRPLNGLEEGVKLRAMRALRMLNQVHLLYPSFRSDALALGVLILAEADGDDRKGFESVRLVQHLPDNELREQLEEVAYGRPTSMIGGVVRMVYSLVRDFDRIDEAALAGTEVAVGRMQLSY